MDRQPWLVADTRRSALVVTVINGTAAVLLWGFLFVRGTTPIDWWWVLFLLATAMTVVAALGLRTLNLLRQPPPAR